MSIIHKIQEVEAKQQAKKEAKQAEAAINTAWLIEYFVPEAYRYANMLSLYNREVAEHFFEVKDIEPGTLMPESQEGVVPFYSSDFEKTFAVDTEGNVWDFREVISNKILNRFSWPTNEEVAVKVRASVAEMKAETEPEPEPSRKFLGIF